MDDWTCEAIEGCSPEDAEGAEGAEDTQDAEDPSSNAAAAIAPSKRPRSESNGSGSDKPASDCTKTKPTQFCHNMRFITWGSDGLVK